MNTGPTLADSLADQIDKILDELHGRTSAECALLADSSGHLLGARGKLGHGDPDIVAALAASQVAAITELVRRIGEENPHGSFLHEGESKGIYLVGIPRSFILIVVFQPSTPIGLIRLFANRAAEQLRALAADFEELTHNPGNIPDSSFLSRLSAELDKGLTG